MEKRSSVKFVVPFVDLIFMNASVSTEILTNAVVSAEICEQVYLTSFHDAGLSSKNSVNNNYNKFLLIFAFPYCRLAGGFVGLLKKVSPHSPHSKQK